MVESFWVCEISDAGWKTVPGAMCNLGRPVSVTQVLTTVFSDMILVISPLIILRNVRVDQGVRFRLVSLFAVSLLITVAAVIRAAFILVRPGVIETTAAVVEVFVALTVCNVTVVVPAIFRRFSDKDSVVDGSDYRITISGNYHNHTPNATVLSTLNATDRNAGLRVHVNVIKEEIQTEDGAWDGKAEDVKYMERPQDFYGYAT